MTPRRDGRVQQERAGRRQRELDADFDPQDFDHVALFDDKHEWVEMRLRARREHTTLVRDLDLAVHFDAGEELRTEISAKFTPERLVGDSRRRASSSSAGSPTRTSSSP